MGVQGKSAVAYNADRWWGRREFERFRPSAALAEYVRFYAYQELDARVEGSRPYAVSLFPVVSFYLGDRRQVFEYSGRRLRMLPESIVLGPCDHRVADLIDAGRYRDFTIVFEPAGLYRLFHVSPAEIRNHAYDCRDVLGAAFAGIYGRLVEQSDPQHLVRIAEDALLQKLSGALSGTRMQRAAELLLRTKGNSILPDVAGSLGFSDSSWRRHFTNEVGVPPKRYMRMLRFQHAVALRRHSPHLSWTEIAHEAGYYDQSHFIGEFREMGGSSPSEFMRELAAASAGLTEACCDFGGNLQAAVDVQGRMRAYNQGAA